MPYRIAVGADREIDDIYTFGFVEFGEAQADRYITSLHKAFELLSRFPRSGRALRSGFRFMHHEAHVVIYQVGADNTVTIARVLSARSNWREHLP